MFAVLNFTVDVEAVGHGRRVGRDQQVSGALEARPLCRGATAAADEFDFPGQEHLERLTAALQQEKVDVDAVAFEGADLLGDIERLDAAADAG